VDEHCPTTISDHFHRPQAACAHHRRHVRGSHRPPRSALTSAALSGWLPEGNSGRSVQRVLSHATSISGLTTAVSRSTSRDQASRPNAFIESFNGKFRAGCLNAHWFMSLDDARRKCEDWRRDYNKERPHSAIGNVTPMAVMNRSAAHGHPGRKTPRIAQQRDREKGSSSSEEQPLPIFENNLGSRSLAIVT
jgi:putative transposase